MFFHMVYKSGQIFLPFCHNPRVWRTDGRTDRILLAIPRLHYMQRGKNEMQFIAGLFYCSIVLFYFTCAAGFTLQNLSMRWCMHIYVDIN